MCTQTGLNPNRRTVTAAFAWVVEMFNGQQVRNFWVDMSQCGLEYLDQYRAELLAAAPVGTTFPVSQYHIYFQDGGHARPKSLYDIKQAEASYNRYYPELGAQVLTPTPEYWIQEGITENPYYVAP
ncbi:hypothetical protein Amme3_00135 [Pseudomonas phage vB_PpuM-Amme-3]|uniref:Uncharacterized protein n=2 Tax=Tartuvirus TaxID=3424912 RepID=A0AAX4MY00_9CAUD